MLTGVLEKVAALCQKHGFVYPIERMIGDITFTGYNYGPMGALLRRNLRREWWHSMLVEHGDIFAVEDGRVSSPVDTFHRQSLDDNSPEIQHRTISVTTAERNVRHSLLEDMMCHYLPTLMMVRQRIPFGLAQESNHIVLPTESTHQNEQHFLWSSSEQCAMCAHYFVPPYLATQSLDTWQRTRLQWWKRFSGEPSKFSTVDISGGGESDGGQEMHIQYEFPWGRDTVERIRNYGDRHVARHHNEKGISHEGKHGRKLVLPHQIECHMTLEKGLLAYLLDAYHEKPTAKENHHRMVVQFHARLAPYKVALVCNGSKATTYIREVADHLAQELRQAGITVLDLHDTASLMDTQYAMYDELGVPWTAVLNDNTMKNGLVLLRNRDTTIKEKISIVSLKEKLRLHSQS